MIIPKSQIDHILCIFFVPNMVFAYEAPYLEFPVFVSTILTTSFTSWAVCCLKGWLTKLASTIIKEKMGEITCRAMQSNCSHHKPHNSQPNITLDAAHNIKQQINTTSCDTKQTSAVAKWNLHNWKTEPSGTSERLFIALQSSGAFDVKL